MLSALYYKHAKEGIMRRPVTPEDVSDEVYVQVLKCEAKAETYEKARQYERQSNWLARAKLFRERAEDPVYLAMRVELNLAHNEYGRMLILITDTYPTPTFSKKDET